MNKKTRNEEYLLYVERKTPKTGWFNSLFHAFIVGGMICCFGQMCGDIIKAFFPTMDMLRIGSWISIIVIIITILLTAFGIFDRIAKFGGGGTFIPISGFANSLTSAAMESRSEGLIYGIGSNMFKLAGSVIVYGIVSVYFISIIKYLIEVIIVWLQ